MLSLLVVLVALDACGVAFAGPVVTTVMSHGISFQRKSGNSAAAGSQASAPPHFGSQQWLLRGHMVSFRSADISSYARKTVFVPVETHVSPDEWKQLMALPVRGVVAVTSPFDRHNEMLLQHFLSREAIPIPVYFLPYDDAAADKLKRTFDELSFNEYAVISVGNSTRDTAMTTNSSFTGIYIHTSLKVKPKEATESTPRLLVTASFDTLGVSPASRTTGGASATVAAVELWWRLQADAVQMAGKHTGNGGNVFPSEPYSVSLLLGNTARFNYAGTGRWLSTQKEEDMDRYALVLCLDELLSDGYDDGLFSADGSAGTVNSNHKTNGAVQLYMHVHDSFSSDPYFLHVKRLAEGAATKHGITLATQVTKTNYQHYDINFEHEVLAHRQIHAVTISSTRRQRVGQLFRGSSLPLSMGLNASSGDAALARRLSRTVDFVYDFSRGILRLPEVNITHEARPWIGSDAYMLGLLRHATESSRSPVAGTGASQLIYANALKEHIQQRMAVIPAAARRTLVTSTSLSTYRLTLHGVALHGPYEQVARVFVAKSTSIELLVLITAVLVVGVFAALELGLRKTYRVLISTEGEEADVGGSTSNWGHGD